ncbi:class I SAM-dependent methyltransferase [Francisella noatunensis subsp. orientalis]|uniref:Methyltransferase n=4 Tax=Francisella orientalis TaxID=299583 RepID=A0AAP6XAI7_9GAMM|nr:class I SAM-dependent methyltransferase [Francisella orientalis]AHB99184.1 hypothetical protein M973_05105 [Francisella orientalis LADL 07-285A]AKN85574.1 Methyltransferase [Francisella orientalis FNO12]AKN87114.1 Methyltransferase [Francisella orientalis FNO24]AKN88651.1 Methyltransferase [Francisella orientalis]AKU05408.1 Methyltransferase [Francisella orientalis]
MKIKEMSLINEIEKQSIIYNRYIELLHKKHIFNHSLFYIDKSVENYNTHRKNEHSDSDLSDEINIIKKIFSDNKNQEYLFVSIGCRSGLEDTTLLKSKNYDITYLGVDSSERMLEAAKSNLIDINIQKNFLLCDVLNSIYDLKIFIEKNFAGKIKLIVINGGTFGNFSWSDNEKIMMLLNKDDYFYIYIATQANFLDIKNLRKRYLSAIKISEIVFKPFYQTLNLKISDGNFNLEEYNDDSMSTTFKYTFIFSKNINKYLMKDDEVEVLKIRVYQEHKLISKLKEKNIYFIDSYKINTEMPAIKILFQYVG